MKKSFKDTVEEGRAIYEGVEAGNYTQFKAGVLIGINDAASIDKLISVMNEDRWKSLYSIYLSVRVSQNVPPEEFIKGMLVFTQVFEMMKMIKGLTNPVRKTNLN